MIIYDVLQHYYDERRSPESRSSLLTSTTEEHAQSDNLSKHTMNARFKRRVTRRMFRGVLFMYMSLTSV